MNAAEAAFRKAAQSIGIDPLGTGWPDFLVDAGDETCGVEVKFRRDRVTMAQRRMFALLERAGLPVFVWRPEWPEELRPWRQDVARHKELKLISEVQSTAAVDKDEASVLALCLKSKLPGMVKAAQAEIRERTRGLESDREKYHALGVSHMTWYRWREGWAGRGGREEAGSS